MTAIWIPILGGLMFSAGLIGLLLVLETWIYDFGEEDVGEEEEEDGEEKPVVLTHGYDLDKLAVDDPYLFTLITYLDGLNIYQLHLFATLLKDRMLSLKEGGLIADFGRNASIKMLKIAENTGSRVLAINNILYAITGLQSVLALTIFLEFFVDLALDLFGANPFGFLALLKWAAKLKKLDRLVDRIEQIQLLKSRVDRIQGIKQLKEDFENAGENIIKLNGMGVSQAEETRETSVAVTDIAQAYLIQPVTTNKGWSPTAKILSIVGVIGILMVVFYALFGGFRGTDATADMADTTQGESVDSPELDLDEPTATPAPTPTLSPLDILLRAGNFTEEQKAQLALAYLLDPEGDWIYSISAQIALLELAQVDITGYLGVWLRLNSGATGTWFNNSYYPCDQEIPGGRVVCPPTAGDMPEGRILMLVMQLADPVPQNDPDRFYTYAAVLDADGDPSNNFQFNSPYDWDYWQNTDQWYILDWVPENQAWNVSVVGENWAQVNSNARVVIYEDLIMFFIPANEFSAEYPAYRMSAFGHDGSYQPDVSSGDVTGANPSEALTPLILEEVIIEE